LGSITTNRCQPPRPLRHIPTPPVSAVWMPDQVRHDGEGLHPPLRHLTPYPSVTPDLIRGPAAACPRRMGGGGLHRHDEKRANPPPPAIRRGIKSNFTEKTSKPNQWLVKNLCLRFSPPVQTMPTIPPFRRGYTGGRSGEAGSALVIGKKTQGPVIRVVQQISPAATGGEMAEPRIGSIIAPEARNVTAAGRTDSHLAPMPGF
jgi:hypothetical protein